MSAEKKTEATTVDLSKISDFEISVLVIERDVAQYRVERLDELLNKIGEKKGYINSAKKESSSQPDHPEVYERLNWENRDNEHGPFQMLRKDNCNDTQLFNHLDAMLKQNKNNVSIGDWHYWAGDPGYIFRRRKKQSKPQAKE
jgi:hypothetical protein